MNLKGQRNYKNKFQHQEADARKKTDQDANRNYKRAIGTIYQVDPNKRNKMVVTAWVPRQDGGRRLWGEGREITILDSKLDVLQRFGTLEPGMVIEILWRGIDENSTGFAKILSEGTDEKTVRSGEEIPSREVDTESSLPFEPFGFL